MTARKVILTDKAPAPLGPYSQAIAATGMMIFLSGQLAIDPATGAMVGNDDIVKETNQVMNNIQALLAEAGATWENVVKVTIFLTDLNDFPTVNQAYGQYFTHGKAPARSCVQVSRLPKDANIEIECIAVI